VKMEVILLSLMSELSSATTDAFETFLIVGQGLLQA